MIGRAAGGFFVALVLRPTVHMRPGKNTQLYQLIRNSLQVQHDTKNILEMTMMTYAKQ